MRSVEIYNETTTLVTYNGRDVNDVLQEVCSYFHEILTECSSLTDKLNNGQTIEEGDIVTIEGLCCEILDYLGD